MPFTFSHPAIILPLNYLPKKWFSLTALVIGSLTPDFEYFIRMDMHSDFSHTALGLLWFDVPLGIILTFIFHNLIRDCLFDNLPLYFKSRFIIFNKLNWNSYFIKNWFVISISLLIGAASHNFWDSFTHEHAYAVDLFPVLKDSITLFNSQIPLYKIAQHSSTLLGALIISLVLIQLPKHDVKNHVINYKYWMILIAIIFSIVITRLALGLNYKLYGIVIVTAISATIIGLIITPKLIKLLN